MKVGIACNALKVNEAWVGACERERNKKIHFKPSEISYHDLSDDVNRRVSEELCFL